MNKPGGETLGRLDVQTEPPGLSLRRKDTMKEPFIAKTFKVSVPIRATLNFIQIMTRRCAFASSFQMQFQKDLIDELTRVQCCLDQLKAYVRDSKDSKLLKAMRVTIDTLMDENANLNIAYDLKHAELTRAYKRLKETYETKNKQEGMAAGVREGCGDAEQAQLGRVRPAVGEQPADDGSAKPAAQGDPECDCA